jgi:hypothetical protein
MVRRTLLSVAKLVISTHSQDRFVLQAASDVYINNIILGVAGQEPRNLAEPPVEIPGKRPQDGAPESRRAFSGDPGEAHREVAESAVDSRVPTCPATWGERHAPAVVSSRLLGGRHGVIRFCGKDCVCNASKWVRHSHHVCYSRVVVNNIEMFASGKLKRASQYPTIYGPGHGSPPVFQSCSAQCSSHRACGSDSSRVLGSGGVLFPLAFSR